MIHSRLKNALDEIAHAGFSLQSHAGTSDHTPSLFVTAAQTVDAGSNILFPLYVDLWLKPDDRMSAKAYAIVNASITISSGEFSYPHERFLDFITKIRSAGIASANELGNGCNRFYFAGILQAVVSDLRDGKINRAIALAEEACSEVPVER